MSVNIQLNNLFEQILKKKDKVEKKTNIESLINTIQECEKLKQENEKNKKYETKRLALFPIKYPKQWEMFKKQQAHFWTTEGIDFSNDKETFEKLPTQIQTFFKKVFSTFNILDSVVNDNIADIKSDLPNDYLEANNYYCAQGFIEAIHMETYSTIVDLLINTTEREYWLNIAKNAKFIQDKVKTAIKYQGHNSKYSVRIIANGCVEAVGFCSLFAPIFWTKNLKDNIIEGIRFSNEEILIDEYLHSDFSPIIYNDLVNDGHIEKLPINEVHEIVNSYVESEIETAKYFYNDPELLNEIKFYLNLNPQSMDIKEKQNYYYFHMFTELNYNNMISYIKYVADTYLTKLNYPTLYNVSNPFPFMDKINLSRKSNFYEKRVAEYSHFNPNQNNIVNNSNNDLDNNIDYDF